MRRLIAASLRFRLLVLAAAGVLVVVGGARLTQMHADVLPENSPTVVEVQTEAPGLSGPEVEALVTVPMEQNFLDGIMGVTSVTSSSIAGLSAIDLHFQPGFDSLHARQLVQERLTQAFALPNVSRPPVLLEPVSTTSRVMMVGLTSTRLSPIDLSVLARWTIVPKLRGLAGVANVSTFGQADRQLQVLVDPARLAAHGITLAQIIETTGNSQLVSPLSYLQGSTPGTGGFIEGPNQRITIRHLLPFDTPDDLAQVPIDGLPGQRMTLGQVATIQEGHQPLIGDARIGGRAGLVLVIDKLPAASVPAVTQEVDQALSQLQPGLRGVQVDTSVFRPATYVRSALSNVTVGAIIALVLAAAALVALLLRVRLAFVALATTALSMIVATLILDLLGYTFNTVVMLGLLVAIAVVGDDASTTAYALLDSAAASDDAEAERHRLDRLARAYGELREPLAYATVAVLLVVAPVFFAAGPTARFVHPMVLAFALAVIASMAVALTVAPALAYIMRASAGRGAVVALPAARAGALYQRVLRRTLGLPLELPLAACLLGLAAIACLPWLSLPRPPTFTDRSLVVHWTALPGTSPPEMDRITTRASSELSALPTVAGVGSDIGRASTSNQIVNPDSAEIWVTLKPGADYDSAVGSVRSVVESTPGMQAQVSTYEQDSMGSAFQPPPHTLTARVYGQDYGQLSRLAEQLAARMSGQRSLAHPVVDVPTTQPTIEVQVNVGAAERAGVKPGDVRRQAATLVSGLTVGNFFEQQEVFDVVVWGTPAARSSLASLRNLLLDTEGGGHVRLGDVATVSIHPDPSDIQHEAISRYVDVTAQVIGKPYAAQRALVASIASLSYPLGYHAEALTASTDPVTSHAAFISYMAAALLGIFLIIQAALDSWSTALLLFLVLPVSLSGGLLVALATGNADTLGALAGLLAILSLTTRQGLGLASRVRRLHEDDGGELTIEHLTRAGRQRLAPVMTSAAVVLAGVLPFAVMGAVPGNETLSIAAGVIIGGLCSSTVVVLFLLPAALWHFRRQRTPVEIQAHEETLTAEPVGV